MRGGCSACQVCTASTNAPPAASTALVTAAVVSTCRLPIRLGTRWSFSLMGVIVHTMLRRPTPMRTEPDRGGLAQWSEADGPSTMSPGSGIPVPLWARGALTPRTPRDVPACSTHAGYHSPPPRQQQAEHSARVLGADSVFSWGA